MRANIHRSILSGVLTTGVSLAVLSTSTAAFAHVPGDHVRPVAAAPEKPSAKVDTIALGGKPGQIVVNTQGNRAYVADSKNYVAPDGRVKSGKVSVIDTAN